MSNPTAVEFVFERFGRHVAPQSVDAWLKTPGQLLKDSPKKKAGDRSNSMAGTTIFVSDSRVLVFGPDYRDSGFAAAGQANEGAPFAKSMLYSEPTERWVLVRFAKAGVPAQDLYLNSPGVPETAYYDASPNFKRLVRTRPAILARAAQAFAGIESVSTILVILSYMRRHLSDSIDPNNAGDAAMTKKVIKATEGHIQPFVQATKTLALYGLADRDLLNYIELHRETKHV